MFNKGDKTPEFLHLQRKKKKKLCHTIRDFLTKKIESQRTGV